MVVVDTDAEEDIQHMVVEVDIVEGDMPAAVVDIVEEDMPAVVAGSRMDKAAADIPDPVCMVEAVGRIHLELMDNSHREVPDTQQENMGLLMV